MTYSLDLRIRVVAFIKEGGSKFEACRRFNLSRKTVYNWLGCTDLTPKPAPARRKRKLNWAHLQRDVEQNPDKLLRERAIDFDVSASSVWYALTQMQITHKKSLEIQGT